MSVVHVFVKVTYDTYLPIFTYPAYAKQNYKQTTMITHCRDKGEVLFVLVCIFHAFCIISTLTLYIAKSRTYASHPSPFPFPAYWCHLCLLMIFLLLAENVKIPVKYTAVQVCLGGRLDKSCMNTVE